MNATVATALSAPNQKSDRMRVLGIPISLVNLARSVDIVTEWARRERPRVVFVREVPSLMLAVDDASLRESHEQANLVVPDGMPLVWLGRLRGYGSIIGRVCGADLIDAVCARSVSTGQTHFFYGGKPGIAERMARRLCEKYPGLKIAGTFSPPVRNIDASFCPDADVLEEINAIRRSDADFVWVGLSSPKQEFWMTKVAPIVGRGVFFGVGAAFDFHSGAVARAPEWMRNNGLEWLHRLLTEPKRLWRRYLILAPRFVFYVSMEAALAALSLRRTPSN